MSAARGTYTISHDRVASGTAVVTLIEYEHATGVIEVLRCWVKNTASEVSEQWPISLVTKSADGTNVTTPLVVAQNLQMAAHGGTVRGMCTTLGTIDNVYPYGGDNVLNGWEWIASEDEKIQLAPAKTFGIHLPVAPSVGHTINVGMVVNILG